MLKDIFFSALGVIVVVALAAWSGPEGSHRARPIRRLGGANPRPEWPFLVAVCPACRSVRRRPKRLSSWCLPLILIAVLFLVPVVSNRGERAPSRRPVAVLAVIVGYTVLGVLT